MNVFEINSINKDDVSLFKEALLKGTTINNEIGISCHIIDSEFAYCKFVSADNEYNMIVKFLNGSYANQSFEICKVKILYPDDYQGIKLVLFVKNNDSILLLHIMSNVLYMSNIYRLLCNS